MSQVNFSQTGESTQPSPSVWSDCPKTLLNDLGLGAYVRKDFNGDDGTLPGLASDSDAGSTFTYNSSNDSVMDVAVTNTDNNAAAIFTRPLGSVTKNSGNKLWMEARVALAAIADQGVFVGFVELAGASRDVVADNAASNGVITESLIGFLVDNGDTNAFDAIYRKDAGAVVNVLNDVTNATAIPSTDRASLTADGFVKLGVRFDGRDKLHFYVNGVEVATQTVDGTVDQSKTYAAIAAIKTGTAAANTLRVDFFRAAAQLRS